MTIHRCPGQYPRFWKPQDVYETNCQHCGAAVEFFKDDMSRRCPSCGETCVNPKLNLGCLEWCQYADKCRVLLEDKQEVQYEKKDNQDRRR